MMITCTCVIASTTSMMSNVSWKSSPIFLCVIILATIFAIAQGSTTNDVLLKDLKKLNVNRHHVTNPRGKGQARVYIRDTLISLGLHTWTENFTTTIPMKSIPWTGINIVAVLPGRLYKTIQDRLILIGAHYDTMRDTKGVDDNASGVVAMLQVARLLTKKSSRRTREYSVIFVAFDFEEWEKISLPDCACAKLGCGSRAFVANFSRHFDLFPNMSVARYGQLQGAIIMDTMMNYNSTPYSQDVPKELAQPFPQQYNDIIGNQKKGDFLLVTGRNTDDIHLLNTFAYHFMARRGDFNKYKLRVFPLPFDGNTSSIPAELRPPLDHFLRSDHVSFWNDVTSNRAIFLTDTASMRGYMRNCYHKDCDTLSHVTDDFLGFLSKSCDIIVLTTNYLTMVKCENKTNVAPHEDVNAVEGGLIGMGATLFAALNAVAAWIFCQRRKKDDESNLVVNDQLEENKDDVPSQSGTRELQDHPLPEA